MKLIRTIKVVTALPANIEPNTEYLVGAQSVINILGLNGDIDQMYVIEAFMINTGTTGSNTTVQMRYNGDSTRTYDYVRGTGVTSWSGTQLSTQTSADLGICTLNNGYYKSTIRIFPKTGVNRLLTIGEGLRTNSNGQQVTSVYNAGVLWRNSVDNVIALNFLLSEANSFFGVGSEFNIFALGSV